MMKVIEKRIDVMSDSNILVGDDCGGNGIVCVYEY